MADLLVLVRALLQWREARSSKYLSGSGRGQSRAAIVGVGRFWNLNAGFAGRGAVAGKFRDQRLCEISPLIVSSHDVVAELGDWLYFEQGSD